MLPVRSAAAGWSSARNAPRTSATLAGSVASVLRWGRRASLGSLVVLAATLPTARAAADEPPPEVGYDYGQFEWPRAAALGGAVRAFSSSLDALYVNPANMATTRIYHLGGVGQFWPEAGRSSFGGGIVDSITNRLAGGIGGQYLIQDPNGLDREAGDLRIGLAIPFSDRFFLGLAGRHLWLRQSGDGPLGDSPASGGLEDRNIVRSFSFDAGATLRPTKGLSLALVGHNLTNPDHGLLPLLAGGGVGFGTSDFTIEVDALGDFTTWLEPTVQVMGGGELLAADHYPIRLGYRFDQGADSHSVCVGLGYVERAFSANLALRRTVVGDASTAVFLGFEYHLEATDLTPSPADTF